jgi:hypothetical protein
MSIIHDALKKIQNETPPEVKILSPEQNKEEKGTAPYYSQINRELTPIILFCAIVIILGSLGFLYNQRHAYFPKIKKLAKSPENFVPHPNPSVPTQLPAISNTAILNAPKPLNINGVMSSGPNNLALINGHVYQEGDEVDGTKIVKISFDAITVINNGKEEIIRVKD